MAELLHNSESDQEFERTVPRHWPPSSPLRLFPVDPPPPGTAPKGTTFGPTGEVLQVTDPRRFDELVQRADLVELLDVRHPMSLTPPPSHQLTFRGCLFRKGFVVDLSWSSVHSLHLVFEQCLFGTNLLLNVPRLDVQLFACVASQLTVGDRSIGRLVVDSFENYPSLFHEVHFLGPIQRHLELRLCAEKVLFGKKFLPPRGLGAHVSCDLKISQLNASAAPADWQAFLRERYPALVPSP